MNPDVYRSVMRHFVSGVTIVTAKVDKELFGMTVTSFTSVSLKPLLVSVCLEAQSRTHEAVNRAGAYAVNLLGADQAALAREFATPGHSGFEDLAIFAKTTGSPLLKGTIGHVECTVFKEVAAGDHTIFVGQVMDGEHTGGGPLVYYQSNYTRLNGNGKEPE